MSNNIFSIKTFFSWAVVLAFFVVPMFALAQVKPSIYTGGYFPINDYSSVRIQGRADTGGDVNAEVWVEWGTSSSYLNRRTNKQIITTFSPLFFYLSNINQDTRYYYRVVARNSADISYGEIKPMFISKNKINEPPENTTTQTTVQTYNYNYNNYQTNFSISGTSPIVITKIPEKITSTSVKIRALALPGGNISTIGWFEFGATTSLGVETIHKNIGTQQSITFSDTLTNLTPNSTYYVRAVIQNRNGISKGSIVGFKIKKLTTFTTTKTTQNTSTVTSPSPKKIQPATQKKAKEVEKKKVEKKEDQKQTASASSIGKSFLPDSLIGWFLFIILLLLIFILSYSLYGVHKKIKRESKEQEKEEVEMEE